MRSLKGPANTGATFDEEAQALSAITNHAVPEPPSTLLTPEDIKRRTLEAHDRAETQDLADAHVSRASEEIDMMGGLIAGISGVSLAGLAKLAGANPAAAVLASWDLIENTARQAGVVHRVSERTPSAVVPTLAHRGLLPVEVVAATERLDVLQQRVRLGVEAPDVAGALNYARSAYAIASLLISLANTPPTTTRASESESGDVLREPSEETPAD
jgi:hypothetical protein